jgi:hypothetical protein
MVSLAINIENYEILIDETEILFCCFETIQHFFVRIKPILSKQMRYLKIFFAIFIAIKNHCLAFLSYLFQSINLNYKLT